jgi:hypothetical protein
MGTLIAELLKALLPPLVDAIVTMVSDKTDKEVEELRNQPVQISVAFGGGTGESEKTLVEIEAKLPKT